MPDENQPNRPTLTGSQPENHQRTVEKACPYCTDKLVVLDQSSNGIFQSGTLQCETCEECFLHVRRGNAFALIHLPDFLQKRGDDFGKRPLQDRGMSEHLVHAMVCDVWPSPATAVDFGLDTLDHYAAMQRAVKQGLTAYELDRVLGNGQAITQLVAFAAPDRQSRNIKFATAYDDLLMEPAEEEQPRTHQKHKTKYTLDF
jgi:hypothetical protein